MLRMGRSNKPEPAAHDQTARPTYQSPAPPTQGASDAATHTRAPGAPAQPAPPAASANPGAHAFATPTPPHAVTERDALARDLKDGLVGGFVGVHSIISGEANFRGMLRVDGRVAGRVRSEDGTLIVSAGGQVDADIEVAVARINGTVNGDIRASNRIEMGRTARVNGNILTPALVIEQGAIFEGSCRMTAQTVAQTRQRVAASASPRNTATAPAASKEHKPVPPEAARAITPPEVGAPPAREEVAV